MKTKETFIGIDVSKDTIDICVLSVKQELFKIANTADVIAKFFKNRSGVFKVCMENTGRYNWPLYQALNSLSNVEMYVVSPLHLKKSLGLIRGKDDKADAIRIARFLQKHHSDLSITKPTSNTIEQLKVLLTERKQRIKMKSKLLASYHDYCMMKEMEMTDQLAILNQDLVKFTEKQIKCIEKQIESLIKTDKDLHHLSQLILSVPGVGKVLCWLLLAKTNGFTTLNNPRKLACYAGVVPFPYSSGTSIRGKERVSGFADKTLKTVLHMGAMRAVRMDNDFRDYYLRKVAEGKNKMLVLNAVRNKLIHRICAVTRENIKYQPNLVMS